MKLLYIDPFAGAAGDMLLGALLDLGVDRERLLAILGGLHLPGWRLEAERGRQQGFAGTRVRVVVDEESHPARHLADIERLLNGAELPERVRVRALDAFRRIFAAEAEAHGVPLEKAHLHELAAVDAVIDIVGVCAAVELLLVDEIVCGPVPVGSGTVDTAHGVLPVPAPAVALLLRGVPLAARSASGEMTTPTGAALLATLASRFAPLPAGRLAAIGVGLGTRTFPGWPNLLRALMLDAGTEAREWRRMAIVEATIDDATGETLGHLLARLREAGALDAWCLHGTGRKGRPIVELRAVCEQDAVAALTEVLFAEGATLGTRVLTCERPELERLEMAVATRFGAIPVKLGLNAGRVVSAKPEHDACAAAARASGVSLAAVVAAARAAAPKPGDPHPDPGTRAE